MYRTFTTGAILFKKLIVRYRGASGIQIRDAQGVLRKQEQEKEQEQQQTSQDTGVIVRLKVLYVVQTWMEKFPQDFDDPELKTLVYLFAHSIIENQKTSNMLMKRMTVAGQARSSHAFDEKPPPPVSLPNLEPGSFKFTDVNPMDIARQLTLLDFEAFSKVSFIDLQKSTVNHKPPSIMNVVDRFNLVSPFNLLCTHTLFLLIKKKIKSNANIHNS